MSPCPLLFCPISSASIQDSVCLGNEGRTVSTYQARKSVTPGHWAALSKSQPVTAGPSPLPCGQRDWEQLPLVWDAKALQGTCFNTKQVRRRARRCLPAQAHSFSRNWRTARIPPAGPALHCRAKEGGFLNLFRSGFEGISSSH